MGLQPAIAVTVTLIAVCLAALTGSWIAWAGVIVAAGWAAWVAADRVMHQVVDPPFDRARGPAREP
jgi:hypothetical protein